MIDLVDTEYCLRARSLGFQIVLAPCATLLHRIGDPMYRFIGRRGPFRVSNHSPQRHYYMTRNLLVMVTRYWGKYPEWCREVLMGLIWRTVIVVLFEKQRLRKLINMAWGFIDAMRGRMGKVVEL